jgi:GT2 family glycosyltransferase
MSIVIEHGLVSVIIPAYNAEATLARTLESALRQTYSPIEVIVVDDGSTDGTADLCRAAAARDRRVRYVRQNRGGVAVARNRAASIAGGQFLAPLDADDLWHETKIQRQMEVMTSSPYELGFVYCGCRYIDENDCVSCTPPYYHVEGWAFQQHLLHNFVGTGSTPLIRRSTFVAVGGYEPRLQAEQVQGCEDYLLQARIARRYRIAGVPECLVGYRMIHGRMSSNGERMLRSRIRSYELLLEDEPGLSPALLTHGWSSMQVQRGIRLLRARGWDRGLPFVIDGMRKAFPAQIGPLCVTTAAWMGSGSARWLRTRTARLLHGRQLRSYWDFSPVEDRSERLDPGLSLFLSRLRIREQTAAPMGGVSGTLAQRCARRTRAATGGASDRYSTPVMATRQARIQGKAPGIGMNSAEVREGLRILGFAVLLDGLMTLMGPSLAESFDGYSSMMAEWAQLVDIHQYLWITAGGLYLLGGALLSFLHRWSSVLFVVTAIVAAASMTYDMAAFSGSDPYIVAAARIRPDVVSLIFALALTALTVPMARRRILR